MRPATPWFATSPDALRAALVAAVLAAIGGLGPASAQPTPGRAAPTIVVPGDDEAPTSIELPALPAEADLIALPPGPRSDLRFMVDARSVRVLPGGELRYTFVVVSASGSRSVSYEQMRCESREWRLLAVGSAGATWAPARAPRWRLLPDGDAFGQRAVLHKDIFCPSRVAVGDVREAVSALRAGLHPRAISP